MKFHSTLDEYCALIKEIKAMDLPIKVSFGLEVCYVPEYEETLREILKPYHFDFLVGAIHSIDGKLYDMKWSEKSYGTSILLMISIKDTMNVSSHL